MDYTSFVAKCSEYGLYPMYDIYSDKSKYNIYDLKHFPLDCLGSVSLDTIRCNSEEHIDSILLKIFMEATFS